MKKSSILLIIFSLIPLLLLAEEPGEPEKMEIHLVDRSEFPLITISYSLKDARGNYTYSPGGDCFEVIEKGRRESVFGFDEEHAPASLVLILDSSGSMEGSMEAVRQAAGSLIGMLDSHDEAQIVDFDSQVRVVHEFSNDQESLRSVLGSITVGGSTALYDSIVQGIEDVSARQGIKVLVLLTDGKDENAKGERQSKNSFAELKELLEGTEIPVYMIGLGSGVDREVLETIAELSGGNAYYAKEADAVTGIYRDILSYLHSLYRVYYISRNGTQDGSTRKLEVKIKGTGIRASASYQAPKGEYWSYCFGPFRCKGTDNLGLSIIPDGSAIAEPQYRVILSAEGKRTYVDWRWADSYRGTLTKGFYLARGSYGWTGSLYQFNGKGLRRIENEEITSSASGDFHRDWEWNPVALSRNSRYLLLSTRDSRDSGDEYNFTFLLMDWPSKKILWERGVYSAEFDEPGALKVTNEGTSFICQDFNIFVVDREGKLLFKRLFEETGKRYWNIGVSGDGSRFIVFLEEWGDAGIELEYDVEVCDSQGEVLWGVLAERGEFSFTVDVSQNGKFFGVCDEEGVRIFDREGEELYRDFRGDLDRYYGTGLSIADDGSFVYSLANRIYYRKLE